MKVKNLMIIIFSMLSLTSCVLNKKITYIQSLSAGNDFTMPVKANDYTLLPNDNLFIRVITPDPQWSNMFNTMPVANTGINVTEQSADLLSYPVNSDGTILLPYVGKIMVAGKTIAAITDELEKILKGYVADAAVTVKMVNNYVSLLGEVQHPGRYPLYKDRMNIFQALAMAGDLSEYSNRQKLKIIRPTMTGNKVREFTVTDTTILTSEYFYVMPNDVIYAKPMKGKFFRLDQFPYTVILTTITTFILLKSVIK